MYEFRVEKSANDIEDICVAYGLCSILESNDIKFTLKDNMSMYSIYTEEFDLEEIVFNDLNTDCKPWNINTNSNNKEMIGRLKLLNEYFNSNMIDILNYYLGINKNKLEKESAVAIGSNYYTYSIRGGTGVGSLKVNKIISYMSMLGWIYSASYCINDKNETTMILKPKNTNEIKRPYNFSYIDKETGEIKIMSSFPKGDKGSHINTKAIMMVNTLINHNLLQEEYSDIICIQCEKGSNKPSADKTFNIKIPRLSQEFLNDIIKSLTWSKVDIDVKEVTSKYILDIYKYKNFSKLIRIYGKVDNAKINMKFKEEILKVYNDKINEIYNCESIIKLGRGLGRLLKDKSGFEIQTKLYSISNKFHLQRCMRMLIDSYRRKYDKYLIDDESVRNILNIAENKNDCKVCADAMISYAKVFINVKEEK